MPLNISENAVIEFADKGKFQIGLVVNVDTKTSKVKLINQLKRDLVLPPKQILHVLGKASGLDASLPISNVSDILCSIESKAMTRSKSLDLEELWELNYGENSEVTLDMLIELIFDDPTPQDRLAMIRALRIDRIYFKETVPETYQLRTEDVVADIKKQIAAQAEKDAFRLKFASEAAAILALPDGDAREDAMYTRDKSFDSAWSIIENYALVGTESKTFNEAEILLALVQKQIGRGFDGTAHLRARSFLKETRYWSPDTNIALLKHNISTHFEDSIEAAAFQLYLSGANTDQRLDLTHLEIFSIDDQGTMDIDDALSLETLENGQYRLGVHIAAPASAFEFDGSLEKEARSRGTSIYLPDSRIPMLPVILSENALSLMEGEKRPAMSFMFTYDAEFNLVRREMFRSVIVSKHRLSYDATEQMIEFGNDALSDMLRTILEITENYAAIRRSAGAIDVNLPEYKVVYNKADEKYELHFIDNGMMSRQLVAECMIMANSFVADYCAENEIPVLYRTQASPSNLPSQEELDAMPNDYIRAVSQRRCMQPASSSLTPSKHAGLGLEKYLQATSPLRRYGDLITHYQLEHFLQFGQPRFDVESLSAVLTETEGPLSSARAASNEANQYAVYSYLLQEKAQTFKALIVQYNPDRPDHPQIMLLDTQTRATITLRKKLPVGTIIQVRVDNANPDEGMLILQYVGEAN